MRTMLGLIGDDRIQTSPSPAIHDAIFGAGTYRLMPATDANAAFADAERTLRGVNVTSPHKLAAARRYHAVLDDQARRVGAVNTVVFDDDGRAVVASNTDVDGVLTAWHRASVVIDNRVVGVVGAGGAARAVVVAAADGHARRLVVHARRSEAAVALVALANALGLEATVADRAGAGADVVVLAASDLDSIDSWLDRAAAPGAVVHDLRYGARAMEARNAALGRRSIFLDGTSMLLAQALASARLFQGRALADGQRAAARRALAAAIRL